MGTLLEHPEEDSIRHVVLSPNEQLLAVNTPSNLISVWSLQTNRRMHVFQIPLLHAGMVFSPDNTRLMVFGRDNEQHIHDTCYWSLDGNSTPPTNCTQSFDWSLLADVNHYFPPTHITATRDGTRVGQINDIGGLTVSDLDGRNIVHLSNEFCEICRGIRIAFSKDGFRLAAAMREIGLRVYDVTTNSLLVHLENEYTSRLSFSPNGQKLVAITNGGLLRTFDIETGTVLVTSTAYLGQPTALELSLDGSQLLVGYNTGAIDLIDLTNGKMLDTVYAQGQVIDFAYHPDSDVIAASYFLNFHGPYDINRLIELSTGQIIQTFTSSIVGGGIQSVPNAEEPMFVIYDVYASYYRVGELEPISDQDNSHPSFYTLAFYPIAVMRY